MTARLIAAALAVVLALLLIRIFWGRQPDTPESASTPLPTPARTPTTAPKPTIASGYRLAGTALGRRGRYAVFEDPDGNTEMYRVGDQVPGLGTIIRVGEVDAVLDTAAGEMRFQVRPAPTKVPENTPTARRARTPSPRPAPSEFESSPSDEPVPPAS